MIHHEGGNFRVVVEGGVALVAVWKRPDLDSRQGMELAKIMAAYVIELASMRRLVGLVFDLHDAPPVAGPVTQGILGDVLGAWERVGRRVAVVVAKELATQALQMKRLVRERASTRGRVYDHTDPEGARAWAAGTVA